MDEEDRKAVMDQLTSYDRFASAVTVGSLNRTLAVVAVPPKASNTQEKWVAFSVLKGVIDSSMNKVDIMCTVTALIFETVGLLIWNYTLNPSYCPAFPTASYEKRRMRGRGLGKSLVEAFRGHSCLDLNC